MQTPLAPLPSRWPANSTVNESEVYFTSSNVVTTVLSLTPSSAWRLSPSNYYLFVFLYLEYFIIFLLNAIPDKKKKCLCRHTFSAGKKFFLLLSRIWRRNFGIHFFGNFKVVQRRVMRFPRTSRPANGVREVGMGLREGGGENSLYLREWDSLFIPSDGEEAMKMERQRKKLTTWKTLIGREREKYLRMRGAREGDLWMRRGRARARGR